MNGSSRVGDIAIDALTVGQNQPVSDVWNLHQDFSGLPVMDDLKNILGVLTVRDLCNQSEWATVGDVMSPPDSATSPNAVAVSPGQLIRDVLSHFEDYVGCPVVDIAQKVVGVISIRDIFGMSSSVPVKELMTTPAVVVQHDQPVFIAAVLMIQHNFRRLPVVDQNGKCLGIVTRADVAEQLSS